MILGMKLWAFAEIIGSLALMVDSAASHNTGCSIVACICAVAALWAWMKLQ